MVLILTAVYVAISYASFKARFHLQRNQEEIIFYSPTWRSLGIADFSRIWGHISNQIHFEGGRFEVQMFVGISVLLLAFLGLLYDRRMRLIALVVFGILMFVTRFGSWSIYSKVATVPGFDSMRAPGRVILILVFPIGLMAAAGLEVLIRGLKRWPMPLKATTFLVSAAVIIEAFSMNFDVSSRDDWMKPVYKMEAELTSTISSSATSPQAFLVLDSPTRNGYALDIDAMLTAQRIGIPTLNGYSGFDPYGGIVIDTCEKAGELISQHAPDAKVIVLGGNCNGKRQ